MLSQSIEKIKTSIEVGKERIKQDQLKQLKYSREIDKLKRQVTKYNNILNCHNNEIEHFESEIAKMEQENLTSSEMMNHINSEENYYNLIFQIKFFENALNSTEKNDNILNVYQLFKKEILDIFGDKNVLEENLNSKLKTNELNYDNLKIKFNKYEEEINKTNLCINCHNSFILKDNDDVFNIII
jgi:chromosome segregation ATPase